MIHEEGAAGAGLRFGPYVTLGRLGEGGMGVVYRGRHEATGELVALKTVQPGPAANLAAIRREIHALSRARHPGIVRVVTTGVTAGMPWYAMELVEGRPLRSYLDELWDRGARARAAATPAPSTLGVTVELAAGGAPDDAVAGGPPRQRARGLLPTLGLVRRLCSPLALLHGSGIVHRDLKPDNVMLRPDGTPVLVDLGIAAGFGGAAGREELTAEGRMMGSVPYIAPEQIRGDLVDARADLYALGCTLYECVTGRPPFSGAPAAIIFQHLGVAPVPPSHRVDELPPELDRLVLRLLQKRPQDRLGYADDVAEALAALGADAAEPLSVRSSRPYLYRPELAGRDGALLALGGGVTALQRDGRGGLVFLGGESGVGKTRLAMEAARVATQARLAVVTGQCVALGVAEGDALAEVAGPLHPLRPLLLAVADRCREQGPGETVRLLGPFARVLCPYEPALAELAGHDEQPEPAPLPPNAARARVLDALRATLFALAVDSPLLLVLDDLQWADELSLAFLASLVPADLAGRGVLLLGTYRMEEMRGALAAVVHAPGALHLELGRLDAGGVRAMVSGMLALGTPPPDLVAYLERQSDGNPFFIAEYLRVAIAEGLLTRSRAGAWQLRDGAAGGGSFAASLPLPRTLAELIDRRLAGVGEHGLAIAQAAAVLGREVEGDVLAATAGAGDTELMDAVEVLRVRQVMEESGPGRLRFVHDKLRELTYERIPEARRRALHRRAAEVIERTGAGAPGASAVLAHHFARAEVHDQASRCFTRAGDDALRAHANGEAITSFRAAITEGRLARAAGGDPAALPPLGDLHERLADVLALVGRHEDAREAYRGALGEASLAPAEQSRVHRKIGKTLETEHRHDEALRAYDAAEEALGAEPPGAAGAFQDEWVQIQIDRVSVGYWLGRVEAIAALVAEVRPVIERRATPLQRARFFQALTQLGLSSARHRTSPEIVLHARACLDASEAAGDPDEVAWAGFGLATVLLLDGALDEAEVRMLAALGLAERRGNLPLQSRCLAYLTTIERERGRVDAVRHLAARTLAASTEGGMRVYAGAAAGHLAWVALEERDLDGARAHAERALGLWQGTAYTFPFQWMALLPLLAVELEQGRVEAAAAHALALLDETQQRLPDELSALLARASGEAARPGGAAGEALGAAVAAARRLRFL